MKNFKHLITSGCSFTQAGDTRWPVFLSKDLNLDLDNRGQSGASNSWISRTAIYQSEQLIKKGICPSSILMTVMWSSFDRISLYSESEYKGVLNFIDRSSNVRSDSNDPVPGFLEGSIDVSSTFQGSNQERLIFSKFIGSRLRAIKSYENILRLQWYCENKKITLINLAICDIFKYPNYNFLDKIKLGPSTPHIYSEVRHLHDMINFDNWAFYNGSGGMYEYVANEGLSFEADGHHPSIESHKIYVKNFLLPFLKQKGII